MTVPTGQRLAALRALMKQNKVNMYIVPSEDAHSSEYVAECDARRAFISGFDGSAGVAVVTESDANLFTDGRYFNQASHQLDSNWTLMKQGLPGVPVWQEFVVNKALKEKLVIGIDSTVISYAEARDLQEQLDKGDGAELVDVQPNLVDKVWADARPTRTQKPVFVQPAEYAGRTLSEKIADVQKFLEQQAAEAFVVSMLDEVAYLLNLRGDDVPYNPVFFAYAAVTRAGATLFINEKQIPQDVREHLGHVEIRPYEDVFSYFKALSAQSSRRILVSNKASWALALAIGANQVGEVRSPISDAKGIKNAQELKGMKKCHVRDGAALVEYFAWLEDVLASGREIDEVDAVSQLAKFRSEKQLFAGLSFPTISSSGPNCAVIHYQPEKPTCRVIDPQEVYLCDSGAQFKDGTTDVTRTWHFAQVSDELKRCYTLVLKGHIAIATAVFPGGTTGYMIDCFARQHLWKHGLDYLHGTGHGVGSYLNVHELPVGIGGRIVFNSINLVPGMVLSNEPGFYRDGEYGMRIENLVTVVEADVPERFGGRPYYAFENLTWAPLCRKMIDVSLLTEDEIKYVDTYHASTRRNLASQLEHNAAATAWLERETQPLQASE